MIRSPVIGVDPGVQGAIVELDPDGRTVRAWAAWHPIEGRTALLVSGFERRRYRTLGAALFATGIRAADGAITAVEDLHIPRILKADGEESSGEIGALYYAAGRILGILEDETGIPVLRPSPATWRAVAWGKWGRTRAEAKGAALKCAPLLGDWSVGDPFGAGSGATQDEREGLAEAFGIARWAWTIVIERAACSSIEDLVGRTP